MIRSFKDRTTEEVFAGTAPKRFPTDLVRRAQLQLVVLHNARELGDLRTPPGNRLEALRGDRTGQHSVRINDQWRICFRWSDGGADDVEIVDYH
jgi:proteic killer suppression protein